MLRTLGGSSKKPRQRGWNLFFRPVPLPSPDPKAVAFKSSPETPLATICSYHSQMARMQQSPNF